MIIPKWVNCESTEIATTENLFKKKILILNKRRDKSTFSIDISKFFNTIRKSNNFSWTYKCTRIDQIKLIFNLFLKLTNLMDRIEAQDIYL